MTSTGKFRFASTAALAISWGCGASAPPASETAPPAHAQAQPTSAPPAAKSAEGDASSLLAAMKEASGGARWNAVGTVHSKGDAILDGVKGTFTLAESVTDGRFALRAQHTVFVEGEGFDGSRRWRQDASGQVHDLDSPEATAIAASETYLARRAYLFPDKVEAQLRRLPSVDEDGKKWDRLEATPRGGHAITLRIDPTTHLVDRATYHLQFYPRIVQYSDYRAVDGLMLPFSVITSHEEALTVTSYRVEGAASESDYAAPSNAVTDVRMPGKSTTARMDLEPGGRFLVQAKINGKGPFPFILDTGGHAILTPEVATQLGLTVVGGGVTFGAGEGSTPTRFTKVASLSLGRAELSEQPFTVLPMPNPVLDRGTKTRIAGLLGLEIFERFIVAIDYDRNTITFASFDSADAVPRGTAVPIRFTLDMPLAEATLDGRKGLFGIDTGNSGDTVIFREWATSNGIADRYRAGLPLVSLGAGGESVNYLARTESFSIGGANVPDHQARLAEDKAGAFASVGEAGNIGQAVFARFNVTFDYRKRLMFLEPRRTPRVPAPPRSGFGAAKARPDLFKVTSLVKDGPAEAAGLRQGDSIVAIDGIAATKLSADVPGHKSRQAPGTKLRLTVLRDEKRQEMVVTLRELLP